MWQASGHDFGHDLGRHLWANHLGPLDWVALAGLIAALALSSSPLPKWPGWRAGVLAATLFLLFFSLGAASLLLYQKAVRQASAPLEPAAVYGQRRLISAIVLSSPVPRDSGAGIDSTSCMLLVTGLADSNRQAVPWVVVSATLKGISWRDISPGDRVLARARLFLVRDFNNPASFSFSNYWMLRGIRIKASVASPLDLVIRKQPAGPHLTGLVWMRVMIEAHRHRLMEQVARSFPDSRKRALAMALVFGEKAWMDEGLRDQIYLSGIGHLFAVSGLHMAMVFLLVSWLSRRLLTLSVPIAHRINAVSAANCAGAAACLVYTAMAGFSPSSLRAFIMVAALALSMVIKRRPCLLNSLCLAAWLLLLKSPYYLFDISFQLSFAAVFFLVLALERPIAGRWHLQDRPWPVQFALVTLVAWAATSPLILTHFQRTNLAGVPLNLLIVPVVEFMTLPLLLLGAAAGQLAWMVGQGQTVSDLLWRLSAMTLEPLLTLTHHASSLPGLVLRTVCLRPWQVFLLLSILGLSFLLPAISPRGTFKARGLGLWLLGLFFILLPVFGAGWLHPPFLRQHLLSDDGAIRLHVLDVGDGLSQVLELPGARVMVVDGGGLKKGRFKVGRAVVAPFVRWLGYRRIDWLVASHPHRDHASGIADLLEEFPAGKVFLNDWPGRFETYERIRALAQARSIPVVAVGDRLSLNAGGARVDLIPCSRCNGCRKCVNRGCLVVRAEAEEGSSLLLTADIDRIREAMLLDEYGRALASDVMVVPHHGSLTSSSEPFLSAVHPSLALVSSASCRQEGAGMVPAAPRYRRIGCEMLCTATSGAVSVTLLKGPHVELVSGPFDPSGTER